MALVSLVHTVMFDTREAIQYRRLLNLPGPPTADLTYVFASEAPAFVESQDWVDPHMSEDLPHVRIAYDHLRERYLVSVRTRLDHDDTRRWKQFGCHEARLRNGWELVE